MSTDHEYDIQQSRSMLDEPDDETLDSNRSPELQGQYPSQFDPSQAQQGGEYYQQATGMQSGSQQVPPHSQYEESQQMVPPTSQPGAPDGQFDVDPNDPMLDADPFGLSASMHYPTNYSYEQQQQHHHHGQR